uniref:Biogenesis of lysosome-related organelles complex 1 subunit 3 n=1 Tax=Amblyomma aureolatum TaxID=187763 RepID=A0A1E1WZK7_9ACAR
MATPTDAQVIAVVELLSVSTSQQATVVCGEASESDDEDLSVASTTVASDMNVSSVSESVTSSERRSSEPDQHRTLLHRKLRERNASLRRNCSEMVRQPYQNAVRELGGISQNLVRSQQLLQEVSASLRKLTNELFQIEDKIDTIQHCNAIPEITIPSSNLRASP